MGHDGGAVCFGERMEADFAARSSEERRDLWMVLFFFGMGDWGLVETGGGKEVWYSSLGRL